MIDIRTVACLIFGLICPAWGVGPAHAVIDAQHLGARYDPVGSNIVFRVYSSRATRIELHLYAEPNESPALATYVLTRDAADIWSASVRMADLRIAGIGR
jgi:isoamylase